MQPKKKLRASSKTSTPFGSITQTDRSDRHYEQLAPFTFAHEARYDESRSCLRKLVSFGAYVLTMLDMLLMLLTTIAVCLGLAWRSQKGGCVRSMQAAGVFSKRFESRINVDSKFVLQTLTVGCALFCIAFQKTSNKSDSFRQHVKTTRFHNGIERVVGQNSMFGNSSRMFACFWVLGRYIVIGEKRSKQTACEVSHYALLVI